MSNDPIRVAGFVAFKLKADYGIEWSDLPSKWCADFIHDAVANKMDATTIAFMMANRHQARDYTSNPLTALATELREENESPMTFRSNNS